MTLFTPFLLDVKTAPSLIIILHLYFDLVRVCIHFLFYGYSAVFLILRYFLLFANLEMWLFEHPVFFSVAITGIFEVAKTNKPRTAGHTDTHKIVCEGRKYYQYSVDTQSEFI